MLYEGYFELLVGLGVASCKVIQDSLGLDSTLWIPNSLSVGLGFRIPIFSLIPDSLS